MGAASTPSTAVGPGAVLGGLYRCCWQHYFLFDRLGCFLPRPSNCWENLFLYILTFPGQLHCTKSLLHQPKRRSHAVCHALWQRKKSMAENARKVIKTQAAKFKIRDSSFSRSRSLALCSAWFFLRRVAIHDLVTGGTPFLGFQSREISRFPP